MSLNKIKENPVKRINEWANRRFKLVGEKVLQYLMFGPISLIMPPIRYADTTFTPIQNHLILGLPGTIKSACARAYENFAYNPFPFEEITEASMQSRLAEFAESHVTLITGDAFRIFRNANLVKVLEGVIYDGRVSKSTMRENLQYDIKATSYVAGVPEDLTMYLNRGLLFRVVPIILIPTKKEQDIIGEEIVKDIEVDDYDMEIKEEHLKEFYEWLQEIQMGESNEFKQITGYIFSDDMKKKIFESWKNHRKRLFVLENYNWIRELHRGFSFLGASALINIANRDVKDGRIIPTEEDLIRALKLMRGDLVTKDRMLKMNALASKCNTTDDLKRVAKATNLNLKSESGEILQRLVKGRLQ